MAIKKVISWNEHITQQQIITQLKANGFKFINDKKRLSVVGCLGLGCLAIAIIPNGLGLIFYPLGFMFLKTANVNTYKIKSEIKRRLKNKLYRRLV